MVYKKSGRPKVDEENKRDKVVKLMLTPSEHQILQSKAQGFVTVSDFIRTRIFFDSTLQQVQPEEFIQTLKDYLTVLSETKAVMSETLSVIKGRINNGESGLTELFSAMMEQFKQQVKMEKTIATYMQRMLKAGRKSTV